MEWYSPDGVYVELQQNLLKGDTARNRELAELARSAGVPLAASNDVHYHSRDRYRLQHALIAAKRNVTIEQALPFIKPNDHLCLKPPDRMKEIFRRYPEAVANTFRIAERCEFNLATGLGYSLPESAVPRGYTADGYLRRLCFEAARRRYGPVSQRVADRLEEEFRLIGRHGLAGFLLLYREIVLLGREIMEERGLLHPERPWRSPAGPGPGFLGGPAGRLPHRHQPRGPPQVGSDPGAVHLEGTRLLPDIDLDSPRALRDELIRRVHRRFGQEHAVLAGAIGTYSVKGIIQDLGKVLGLPKDDGKSNGNRVLMPVPLRLVARCPASSISPILASIGFPGPPLQSNQLAGPRGYGSLGYRTPRVRNGRLPPSGCPRASPCLDHDDQTLTLGNASPRLFSSRCNGKAGRALGAWAAAAP